MLDNVEPRNEERVEITSLVLNDAELTHGKADCGLCLSWPSMLTQCQDGVKNTFALKAVGQRRQEMRLPGGI